MKFLMQTNKGEFGYLKREKKAQDHHCGNPAGSSLLFIFIEHVDLILEPEIPSGPLLHWWVPFQAVKLW